MPKKSREALAIKEAIEGKESRFFVPIDGHLIPVAQAIEVLRPFADAAILLEKSEYIRKLRVMEREVSYRIQFLERIDFLKLTKSAQTEWFEQMSKLEEFQLIIQIVKDSPFTASLLEELLEQMNFNQSLHF